MVSQEHVGQQFSGLFHGTHAELGPGDHIVPGAERLDPYDDAPTDNFGYGDNRHVYMTNDADVAHLYGPNVYEVQHHGLVETGKTDTMLHDEFATPKATVLRKVRGEDG